MTVPSAAHLFFAHRGGRIRLDRIQLARPDSREFARLQASATADEMAALLAEAMLPPRCQDKERQHRKAELVVALLRRPETKRGLERMTRTVLEIGVRYHFALALEQGQLPHPQPAPHAALRIREHIAGLRHLLDREAHDTADPHRWHLAAAAAELLAALDKYELATRSPPPIKAWHDAAVSLAASYGVLIDPTARWSRQGPAVRFLALVLEWIGAGAIGGSAIAKVVKQAGL